MKLSIPCFLALCLSPLAPSLARLHKSKSSNANRKSKEESTHAKIFPPTNNYTSKHVTSHHWEAPLINPERGLRHERIIFVGIRSNGGGDYGMGTKYQVAESRDEIAAKIRSDTEEMRNWGGSVIQLYLYIGHDDIKSGTSPQRLPASLKNNIEYVLDQLRVNKVKALLRFAYDWLPQEYDYDGWWIRTHLADLKGVIAKRSDVIFAFQAGLVGQWGEWHNYKCSDGDVQAENVLRTYLEVIPHTHILQVRRPSLKYVAGRTYFEGSADERARVGFHNDYFIHDSGYHSNCNNYHWGSRCKDPFAPYEWDWGKYVYDENKRVPRMSLDGGMPWDCNKSLCGGIPKNCDRPGGPCEWQIVPGETNPDGFWSIERMTSVGYTTFSRIHSASTFAAWSNQALTAQRFQDVGLAFDPDYFKDPQGNPKSRTAADYIRDHLGYRLKVDSMKMRLVDSSSFLNLRVEIKNVGMKGLIKRRRCSIILIENDWVHPPIQAFENQVFEPWQKVVIDHDINIGHLRKGTTFQIGIWLPDEDARIQYNSAYSIKLVGNHGISVSWFDNGEYGVNVLGEFRT